MRIALVTLRFDAPGGVETNVRAVAKGLLDAGDEVTVYASDLYDEGRWERRTEWRSEVDGIPVRRFPVTKRLIPGLTMPLMTGLIDALSEDRPDLIHAHSHRYGHVLEAATVARQLAIPLVISTHYHPADRGEPSSKRMLLRLQDHVFGLSAYRISSAIVVETNIERDLVGEFVPAAKIRIIPPGIRLSDWSHPELDHPPEGLPETYALFAGRIAPNKGLFGLFEAIALLPPERRPHFVLLGKDWGVRASLDALAAQRGISGWIHWLGHLEDERAYRAVFRGSRLFVLPSEYEAYGLVLLEAMAAGIPILATAVGGTPEVLEHGRCGRLVPYGDPTALAAAIAEQWEHPDPAQISFARAKVQTLDWAKAVERHHTLFEESIRPPGP